MAWGSAITLFAYAFYRLSVSGILSHKQRLAYQSQCFSTMTGATQARLGRNLLRQGPKPSVNVAFHLIFGNAVAFLDFAF